MIKRILDDLVASVSGARGAIFLDGDGETIAQSGDDTIDARIIGAWKEIQLDKIKDISKRLGLGEVHAVLFSLDQGSELIIPVADEYCLLIFLSAYAGIQDALKGGRNAIERLKKDIE